MSQTVDTFINEVKGTLGTAGRAAVHAMYPNNYEYYLCTLELIDKDKNLEGLLSFLVMPNSITETKTPLMNVQKTNSAVVTTYNNSFTPRDISIQGTFGRKIRLLLGQKEVFGRNENNNLSGLNFGLNKIGIDPILIKTGYGMIKMLEKMIDKSHSKDDDKEHFLVFTNYSLNHSYVVECLQFSESQSIDNNMIWYYSMELKAVANANTINNGLKNFVVNMAYGAASSSITNVLKAVKRDLKFTDVLSSLQV